MNRNFNTAILIEVASIQNFVFSVNYLKVNVGASSLVEQVLDEELNKAIEEFKNRTNSNIEIGYTGGGNALILTHGRETAKEFVKYFSTELLEVAPGLRVVFAIGDYDCSNFKNSNKALFEKLETIKRNFNPNINLQKFGINAECPRTWEVAEVYDGEEKAFVSYIFKNLTKQRKTSFLQKLEETCNKEGFTITDDIERFGQIKGEENYIALVHIDGNDMGKKKQEIESLEKMRQFSIKTYECMKKSFETLVKETIRICTSFSEEDLGIKLHKEENVKFLPLRPVILGGDDVTFICNGKLGLYLTEFFIKEAEKFLSDRFKGEDNYKFSFSASVIIAKTKYPLAKAYNLAESLCKRCKKFRKIKRIENSVLDFLIITQSITDEAEAFIQKAKTRYDGKLLHFGPYILEDIENEDSFKKFKKCLRTLHDWKRHKLFQFRNLLASGEEKEIEIFIETNSLQKCGYSNIFCEDSHKGKVTPYFDAIEILDFYPIKLLEDYREGDN